MKPSFFSGCHTKKIQVEFYPFFRVDKASIFSKLKIGCSLKGRITGGGGGILYFQIEVYTHGEQVKTKGCMVKVCQILKRVWYICTFKRSCKNFHIIKGSKHKFFSKVVLSVPNFEIFVFIMLRFFARPSPFNGNTSCGVFK